MSHVQSYLSVAHVQSVCSPCPVRVPCPLAAVRVTCPLSSVRVQSSLLSVRFPCPVLPLFHVRSHLSGSHAQSYLCPMSTLIHPFPTSITRITDRHKSPKVLLPGSFSLSKLVLRHALIIYTLLVNSNKLRLNTDQTEIMLVGSASRLSLVGRDLASTGGNKTPFLHDNPHDRSTAIPFSTGYRPTRLHARRKHITALLDLIAMRKSKRYYVVQRTALASR